MNAYYAHYACTSLYTYSNIVHTVRICIPWIDYSVHVCVLASSMDTLSRLRTLVLHTIKVHTPIIHMHSTYSTICITNPRHRLEACKLNLRRESNGFQWYECTCFMHTRARMTQVVRMHTTSYE